MLNVNQGRCPFLMVLTLLPTAAFLTCHQNEPATLQTKSQLRFIFNENAFDGEWTNRPIRSHRCRSQVHLFDVPTTPIDGEKQQENQHKEQQQQLQHQRSPVSKSSQQQSVWRTTQLITASLIASITLIAWEDVSSTHPTRSYFSSERYLGSTVGGMAFGSNERQRIPVDMEPDSMHWIPSYNEVMLKHRTRRVPTWSDSIKRLDVERSAKTIQLALLHVLQCERLAADYQWQELATALRDPILMVQLDEACDTLNRASDYLSFEARSEIGFDFGSCAWRHCGAFADFREAIDELDHLVGVLGT